MMEMHNLYNTAEIYIKPKKNSNSNQDSKIEKLNGGIVKASLHI